MTWLGSLRLGRKRAHIAPPTFEHCDTLSAIHAEAFARPWGPEEFEAFLADSAVTVDGLFLERDAAPSGFVVSRRTLDEAEILSLALARAARGRGYSLLLLDQHLRSLEDRRIATVHLEVEEGNAPAIALYRHAGFVQSGHRPGYYARPDGSRAAALSMTLALPDRRPLGGA